MLYELGSFVVVGGQMLYELGSSVVLVAVTSTIPTFIVFLRHALQSVTYCLALVDADHVHAAHNLFNRPDLVGNRCTGGQPRVHGDFTSFGCSNIEH